jgi:hypothetical protein
MPLGDVLTAENLNQFVRMVNSQGGQVIHDGENAGPVRPGEVYTLLASTVETPVSAYHAVAVSGAMVTKGEVATFCGHVCCSGAAISAAGAVADWGIALEDVSLAEVTSGGRLVKTLLFGVAPARVSVTSLKHRCVDAGASGGVLSSCDTGPAKLLTPPSSLGAQYLMVQMGGGGGGGGCKFAAVTVNPAGGFGAAGGRDIIPASDGTYTITSGGELLGITTLYI